MTFPSYVRFSLWLGLASPLAAMAQPLVDHHQHLLRSAIEPPPGVALSARDLIRQMDEAGIRRAVVLSFAYHFGNPNRPPVENEYDRVRTENDWTRDQAGQYPGRLIAFCAVNPLKSYALEEIARCARDPGLRRGLKLHFGNSDVDLDNAAHVAQLRRVFAAANQHRMAIVGHLRANFNKRRPWGAAQARVFLDQLLPLAPDIPIQIAHLAGAGNYVDGEDALELFADAIAAKDRRMKRVYFDMSVAGWQAKPEALLRQLRRIGMKRLLYASDSPPQTAWKAFRKMPLSPAEFRRIERNKAPYLR